MLRRWTVAALGLAFLCSAAFVQANDTKPEEQKEEFKAKCPVSGQPASKEQTAEYKGKMVYTCCGKCKAAFTADPKKFAVKANHQLVQTGHFIQTKCPFSGGKLNDEQSVKVGGVKVKFCCGNCKGKAEAAKGKERAALVFGEDAFKKGFEAKKDDA